MSFIKQFLNNKSEVGAIAPSSKKLGDKMYGDLDILNSKCIVEFGPGTGVFTLEVLKSMGKDAKLLVFETNDTFFKKLKETINDDRLILINNSAEFLGDYLKKYDVDKVDYIISSLPLTVFPKQLKNDILDESRRCLKEGGQYIQFQYSLNAFKLLKKKFSSVKLKFTLLNIPPAFVYKCEN